MPWKGFWMRRTQKFISTRMKWTICGKWREISGCRQISWTRRAGSIQTSYGRRKNPGGKADPSSVCTRPDTRPGSLCFLVENSLFSGDTLFVDACGRVDMPGGDAQKMWWSLNQILRGWMTASSSIPGHDYGGSPTSTIGEQKRWNPYMRYDSVQQFVRDMGRTYRRGYQPRIARILLNIFICEIRAIRGCFLICFGEVSLFLRGLAAVDAGARFSAWLLQGNAAQGGLGFFLDAFFALRAAAPE